MTNETHTDEGLELVYQLAQIGLITYFVVALMTILGLFCLLGYFLATNYPDMAKALAIVVFLLVLAITQEGQPA